MDRNLHQLIRDLPQRSKTWIVAVRRLHGWIKDEDDQHVRPYIVIAIEKKHDLILGYDLMTSVPQEEEVLECLLGIMLEPMYLSVEEEPYRPRRIEFDPHELAEALSEPLLDLEIKAVKAHHAVIVDFVTHELESTLGGEEKGPPGLLSAEGVTPDLVGDFFAAAAEFYCAGPWLRLSNDDVLAIQTEPDGDPWYVLIMGHGGVDYGLLLYRRWADLERAYTADDPYECIPPEGWHSVSFEPAHYIPIDDFDAVERYGWEVADEMAYPFPAIFDREQVHRPPREELLLLEKLMRAIALFTQDHLPRIEVSVDRPIDVELTVPSHEGETRLHVRYPAGLIQKEIRPYRLEIPKRDLEETEARMDPSSRPVPDRRAMEGMLAGLVFDESEASSVSSVQQAQSIMYRAWEEPDPEARIAYAHKALQISPDCADAYVLLAEEEATSLKKSLENFHAGVEAGERALGEAYFEENAGYFWGLLETRPYMRARQGLANCLWELARTEEAQTHYEEMLRLNPNDNQGIRYTLLDLYLEVGLDEKGRDLLERYSEDPSAHIRYARALIMYRIEGAGSEAEQALRAAIERNHHIPDYLLGRKRVPVQLPDFIGMGDENEAAAYAAAELNYWRCTPNAVKWLREVIDAERDAQTGKKKRRRRKKSSK
jgi:tetratricopeptide (TPR) repeat protein